MAFFEDVFYFISLYCWVATFAAMLPLNPCLIGVSFLLYLPTLRSTLEYAIDMYATVFGAIVFNFDFAFPVLVLFACLYAWLDLFMKIIPWDPVLILVAFMLNVGLQGGFLEAARILVVFLVAEVFMRFFPANPILFGLVFVLNIQVQGHLLEILRVISIVGLMEMFVCHFQPSLFDLSRIFVVIILASAAMIPFL
ncbi:hypothetical protein BGZ61DRAFT_521175 [Ilyonectria robusta]|uniref:uncharacterized protein n=1 Tax=Ilyonectria robusta TaxID=1079257 RepID=UPI001E8D855C|nr:uncharacterized protein BGZ61DRAFT_521175 [Ilyonectria robusta]KAH8673121.1 hypothetical protein BGZ61DRAFT_521175 [Ilyonectria robusta]